MYGSCLNGCLMAVLKKNLSKPNPLELNDIETFANRLKECVKQKDQEQAAEAALKSMGGDDGSQGEMSDDENTKLSKGTLPPVPQNYKKGSPEHWTATAAQLMNVYLSLVPPPSTDAGFVKMIQESALSPANVKGQAGKNCVMVHLDCQLLGEASKRPSTRLPSLENSTVHHTLVANALKGRGATPVGKGNQVIDCPIEGDVMLVNGGSRSDECLAPFRGPKCRGQLNSHLEHFELTVMMSQDSVKAKKKRNRGPVQQVQRMHFISKEPLEKMLPERKHEKFAGTCRGNGLAFVSLAGPGQTWHESYEVKKAGSENLKVFFVCWLVSLL